MNTRFLLLIFLLLLSGCTPDKVNTSGNITVWVEPGILSLSDPYLKDIKISIVFSNSTEHVVAFAENDIDLHENLAIVSKERLKKAKSKSELLDLGLFNPADDGEPILVQLEPNSIFKKYIKLCPLTAHGVDQETRFDELYVVFFGWPNEYGSGYRITDFPKEIWPYVWQGCVTSTPVRVELAESGMENQIRCYFNKTWPTNLIAGQVECVGSNFIIRQMNGP